MIGQQRIVGDKDDRFALAPQFGQQGEDAFACGRVEVAVRLVGNENGRVVRQGAGNGDPLLLAAR